MLHPPEGCFSLYLDGSLYPRGPIKQIALEWLGDGDVAMFKHPHRDCVYDEIHTCVKMLKIAPSEGERARKMLKGLGMPKNFGLWATGMIVRRPGSEWQKEIPPKWWSLTKLVARDQIWLPLLAWQNPGLFARFRSVPHDIFNNRWLRYLKHGQPWTSPKP